MDVIAGICRLDFLLEGFRRISVIGICHLQPDMLIFRQTVEAVLDIVLDGIHHNALALGCGPRLGKGVQLFSLDLKHGLEL